MPPLRERKETEEEGQKEEAKEKVRMQATDKECGVKKKMNRKVKKDSLENTRVA